MSYLSEVAADAPRIYWRLNESSGTTAADTSGNSHPGTYTGSPTLGVSGATIDGDTAVSFSGSGQYVRIAYGSYMDSPTAITGEAWIRTSSSAIMAILDRDDLSVSRVWQFRLNGGHLEFVKIGGTGGIVTATGVASIADGAWHHVAVTYDGSNIRLYVDGSLDKTQAASGDLGTGNSPYAVGANFSVTGGLATGYFAGRIDEPAYYTTTLSGTRIAAHYAAGTGAASSAASGAASLSLSASGGAASSSGGTASLALLATGSSTTTYAAAGTASLTLSAGGAVSALFVTDLSNAMNGRQRHGRGTATVERPAAALPPGRTLGVRYDKAIAYPVPTMVDGRPT